MSDLSRRAPVRPYQVIRANAGSAVVVPYRKTDDALAAVTLGTNGLRWRYDDLTTSKILQGWTTVTGSPPPSSGEITISAALNAMSKDYLDRQLNQVTFEFTDENGNVTQQLVHIELAAVFQGAA